MQGLMSYQRFGRARSLRSNRADERYVLARARSLRSDRAEHAFGCCVATLFELLSNDSRFLRKAFRKEESISKKNLSKKNKIDSISKRPHQRTIKTQVGPNEPSNSPNGRVGPNAPSNSPIRRVGPNVRVRPNESSNSPIWRVVQLDMPPRAPHVRYLLNSDRNSFRFISIGVSVEIL
ncbi:hypothetical protein DY000_02040095 [Brassica cretica]|uniref:DUF4005 domain-containing protein n=1 Tax=Brassica cretica TaxID=69181 RepID=A0ABQ7BRS2_BRACR|nr:hypothetical protein DY000_02040095 [Brassica cretica]